MPSRTLAPYALFIAMLLCPALALSSQSYPRIVKDTYTLARDPACTLCHTNNQGGKNTVTTELGQNLESLGAKGGNPRTLQQALIDAYNDRQDSDGDGATDFAELRAGTDPNVADAELPSAGGGAGGQGSDEPGLELGKLPALPPLPEHGCAVRAPAPEAGPAGPAVPMLVLGLWMLSRLRSRRRA